MKTFSVITVVLCVALVVSHAKVLSRVKRVIGGEEFGLGKWPWLVSLQGKIPTDRFFGIPYAWRTFYCGGSIIDERWVMTAAHCFTENNLGSHARYPNYWHAKMGDIELSRDILDQILGWVSKFLDFDDNKDWYLHADKIIMHPNYDRDNLWENDIALVRLEEAVPVSVSDTPEIQAVRLPLVGNSSFPWDGQDCIMKGWGCTTNGGPVSNTAMEVILPKVSDSECSEYWDVDGTKRLCAGLNLEYMGICSGDSGGPLVCQNERQEWIQTGIASFTSAAQPGNVPGVFTRVSEYVDWIRDVIRKNRD